ncbi:MAG: tetratricopeptide repeat protein [Deltaproteobacteria bacterium]|nr:tetratricopeptide repeat protein [Deltaproteobacteria bacterium]
MARRKLIELDDTYGRSAATEEFLLHLHRSSELLQSERTKDARSAIEMAFDAQPKDPNGQASLAMVYFKLGLYPRAIAIYEKLVATHTDDPVIRLNLALVYFKTGQTRSARDELERVVQIAPDYRKAHGYLGLACQRLGDFERARVAFDSAGADHLAKRMARFVEPDTGATPQPADPATPPRSEEAESITTQDDAGAPKYPKKSGSDAAELLFSTPGPRRPYTTHQRAVRAADRGRVVEQHPSHGTTHWAFPDQRIGLPVGQRRRSRVCAPRRAPFLQQ